jgi:hypothetical protein
MVLALLVRIPGKRPVMPFLTAMLALVLACVALQGCILFTSSVNEPPKIKVLPPSKPAVRGQKVTITADASDPDGDLPRVEWSTSPGKCSDTRTRPPTTFISPSGTATFDVPFDADAPESLCVWAMAIDAQGATAIDTLEVSSQNRPPVAVIKVLAPTDKTTNGHYPLYSYIRLSAKDSTDPDGDTVADPMWDLPAFPANAVPQPKLVPCPGLAPTELVKCLDVGGFAGDYTIELTVSDASGTRSPVASLTLTVDADHPACIATAVPETAVSPIVLGPLEGKTFSIQKILDDGAPFPTPADGAHATPTFAWKVRRNAGAWTSIAGYEQIASLTLPGGSYATGDAIDVSVTISDGLATHDETACDPHCPAGCPQSAQWTVEYR